MHERKSEPKLPVQQLAILGICRFADPVAFTSVFPYLPEMIESFNVPKDQVAKWVGLTSTSFSLSQCLTGIFLGRASDRHGRKPIILLGVFCTMIACILFGFAQSLTWAIIARSMAGASAGTIGIIRTTVAEMVPERELQPRAFSIMPLVWSTGTILGPVIGGALAKPATNFPDLFGDSWLLQRYPFALPNLTACALYLIGLPAGLLFLKETLETKRGNRDYGRVLGKIITRFCCGSRKQPYKNDEAEPLVPKFQDAEPSDPPSYREVFSPQSNMNLLTYTLLALHSIAYDQVISVFLHMPVAADFRSMESRPPLKFVTGFGLDSGRIGVLFTAYGVACMIIQFLVFQPVARHYGVLNCLRACTLVFPLVYFLTPFTALLPTSTARQMALFAVMLGKNAAGVFAFPCTTILLTNSARSLRLLGTLNGVSTSISAIGRAAGPSLAGYLFTLGVDIGWIILPWWTLALLAVLAHISTWWIIEMEGFGGEKEEEEIPDRLNGPAPMAGADGTDDASDEAYDSVSETTPLVRGRTRSSGRNQSPSGEERPIRILKRECSAPIGMGEPLGRSWSSGLGQTMSGHGTGATTYH